MRMRVASLADLEPRSTRKFEIGRGGEKLRAFLANHDGKLVAYLNRCQHLPWPLDWDDGRFYGRDAELFVCHTHGALYEPLSGLCVAGPCAGAHLERLEVVIEGGEVYVEDPISRDPSGAR